MLESVRGSFLVVLGLAVSCAGTQTKTPAVSPVAAEQPKPAQAAAAEPAAPADYLGEGTVIVSAFGNPIRGAEKLTLGKIVTPASEKTKGQYEVELVVSSPDWAAGSRIWTENVVLRSHPATGEELTAGQTILMNYWNPADPSETRNGPWILGVVESTDDLFKKQVSVKSLHTGKTGLVHLHNIRVADEPELETPTQE